MKVKEKLIECSQVINNRNGHESKRYNNTLNAELNPNCHLPELVADHHILQVSSKG